MLIKNTIEASLGGSPAAEQFRILGPVAAPIQRLKGDYRAHLMIKCTSPSLLNRIMKIGRHASANVKKIRVSFDMDPQDML